MSPVDHQPSAEPDPLVLLRSRFRSVTANAIAAGVPAAVLRSDLDELAARIAEHDLPVEVMQRPALRLVPEPK